MSILALNNLSFRFQECNNDTIFGLSLEIREADFVVIAGLTGSGKSTLLRLLKRELTPKGCIKGEILYKGEPLSKLSAYDAVSKIGFVAQNPFKQVVTDKVWHELVFGLENLGLPQKEIRKRAAEVAGWFGLNSILDMNTAELSGGQLQLLNLASVVAMQPEVILLDEPTAQLDPITAERFNDILLRLNRDFGIAIICVEHNLSDVLSLSKHLLLIEDAAHGKYLYGETSEVLDKLDAGSPLLELMPERIRLYKALSVRDKDAAIPLSTADACLMAGKIYDAIKKHKRNTDTEQSVVKTAAKTVSGDCNEEKSTEPALELSEVYFSYDDKKQILNGMDLVVNTGEFVSLLGSNGSGKTTALNLAAGFLKPDSGKVKIFGKHIKSYKNGTLYNNLLAVMPQNVQSLFLKDSVAEELKRVKVEPSELPFDISPLLNTHPFDLSGGEQQLLALALVLSAKPRLLLMDEPAKGLDAIKKVEIGKILRKINASGTTILMVTHDVELAAEYSDRIALVFDGDVAAMEETEAFLKGNSFFTTETAKIFKKSNPQIVKLSEALGLIGGRYD